MTCHQNSSSSQYAQYMFTVNAQAAFPRMLNFFIGSKLHKYQNIAKKTRWRLLLSKEKFNRIHMPGQDGDFRKYTGSLANFIVQNHAYNTQMSL